MFGTAFMHLLPTYIHVMSCMLMSTGTKVS